MRRFTIDSSVDAAYLPIAPSIGYGESSENVVIERSRGTIVLDFDDESRLLGVEILGASILLTPETVDDCEEIAHGSRLLRAAR